jgi:hypothetical protein
VRAVPSPAVTHKWQEFPTAKVRFVRLVSWAQSTDADGAVVLTDKTAEPRMVVVTVPFANSSQFGAAEATLLKELRLRTQTTQMPPSSTSKGNNLVTTFGGAVGRLGAGFGWPGWGTGAEIYQCVVNARRLPVSEATGGIYLLAYWHPSFGTSPAPMSDLLGSLTAY